MKPPGSRRDAAAGAAPATTLAFVEPCLASAGRGPPGGDGWVHEIKFDGYRVQAHVQGGRVRMLTRKGLDWTEKLGPVVAELAGLDARSAIIDGEAIVQDARGVSSFQLLQQELKKGPAARIVLMAFDLLHLDGRDLRAAPLLARKAALQRLLGQRPGRSLLQFSAHTEGDGPEVLAGACRLGLEGIVSKRADRPYRSGRADDWIKAKCWLSDAFVVIGYAVSKGPSEVIGSLVLGYFDSGALVYAGRVGTGFSARETAAIWQALQSIRDAAPALTAPLTREQREGVVWVRPLLVVEIEYRDWTSDGVLRHTAFKAFRHDLDPVDVGRPQSLDGTE